MDWREILGITAGVISLVAFVPYMYYTVRGNNRPSRATWFIWTLNSLLLLVSYDASGAKETVWLAVGYACGCFIISILTIWFGEGGWGWLDRCCLLGAVLGVFLWWFTGSPLIAFTSTLIIDLLGVMPTIEKSWKIPGKESRLAWCMWFLGGLTSLGAIERWCPLSITSITVMSYPIQITVTSGLIAYLLVIGKNQNLSK